MTPKRFASNATVACMADRALRHGQDAPTVSLLFCDVRGNRNRSTTPRLTFAFRAGHSSLEVLLMIEVHELLRTKENELCPRPREIEALRTVTALLLEPDDIADLQAGPEPHASPVPLEASLAEENALQGTSSPDSDEVLLHCISRKRTA